MREYDGDENSGMTLWDVVRLFGGRGVTYCLDMPGLAFDVVLDLRADYRKTYAGGIWSAVGTWKSFRGDTQAGEMPEIVFKPDDAEWSILITTREAAAGKTAYRRTR